MTATPRNLFPFWHLTRTPSLRRIGIYAGARVYVEGRLSLNEWTNADGVVKAGLSVLSWHCRLAQIGRNKVKREAEQVSVAAGKTYHSSRSAPAGRLPASGNDFHDDEIPWYGDEPAFHRGMNLTYGAQ